MGDPRHDDLVEVTHYLRKRFRLLRCGVGERLPNRPGLDRRVHRVFGHAGQIVGNPIDHLVAALPELLGTHVEAGHGVGPLPM